MKDISIIIPVFNAEEYIARCIDSVQCEKDLDLEIIVIDDGSEDNSYAICRKYADADPRIRLIKKKNEGQGFARNLGIALSDSKYLYFLDSDDHISENFLRALFSASEKYNLDICMPYTRDDQYKKALEYIPCVQAGRQFVRSSLIKNNGIWQPMARSGQDGAFIHIAFANCNKLGIVPAVRYLYEARADGTFKKFSKLHNRAIKLIKEHYEYIFYYYDKMDLWATNTVRLAHFFEDETLVFRIMPHFSYLTDAEKKELCHIVDGILKRISANLSQHELETLSVLTNDLAAAQSVEERIQILTEGKFTKKDLPENLHKMEDGVIICDFYDDKYCNRHSDTVLESNIIVEYYKQYFDIRARDVLADGQNHISGAHGRKVANFDTL